MQAKGSVGGRGRKGGSNSRQKQGPVRTPGGQKGYVKFKDSREAPSGAPVECGEVKASVVLSLQPMLAWKLSLKRVDLIVEPVGCH